MQVRSSVRECVQVAPWLGCINDRLYILVNVNVWKCMWIAAVALSVCRAQAQEDRAKTIEYLHSLQGPGGGYRSSVNDQNDREVERLRATFAALSALRCVDGEKRNLELTKRFLKACQDLNSGGYSDVPGGRPSVVLTGLGILAIEEIKLPNMQLDRTVELSRMQEEALQYLQSGKVKTFDEVCLAAKAIDGRQQTLQPTIRKDWQSVIAQATLESANRGRRQVHMAVSAATLLRIRAPIHSREEIVKSIKASQCLDGGFAYDQGTRSDLELTYQIMDALHVLGQLPFKRTQMRRFVTEHRNQDGGYGLAPKSQSTAVATFYASQILEWLE